MFFYSDSATEDIPQIRSYGTRVQELLREIVIASNGNLRLNMIDPEPFSEEEDLATQYGIRAVPVTQGGEGVYFGLVVTQDSASDVPLQMQASETMQLIRPDQEEFLEYEFMKLVTKVANPDRTVIGLITQLDIDTLSNFDLSDKEISEIVQIVSYFNYINRVADGLGLEPEDFIDEKGYKIN